MPIYIKRQPKRALKIGLLVLVSAGLLMLLLSQYKTPLALMIPMFIAAFGFA